MHGLITHSDATSYDKAIFILSVVMLWKRLVAIATKVHMQQ